MRVMMPVIMAMVFFCSSGSAQDRRQGAGGMYATLPQGFAIEIVLQDTLDSRTSRGGQPVRALLASPIVAEGTPIVMAGAPMAGRITDVSGPKMGLRKASIRFVITRLKTPRGTVPLEASAHLDYAELARKGGTMAGTMAAKEVAKRAIPVLGTVFLIQDVAKGVQFVTEEKDITIPAGTRMKLHLDREAKIPVGK